MTSDLCIRLPDPHTFKALYMCEQKTKTVATQERAPIDSFKEVSGNYLYLTLMLSSLKHFFGDVIYYGALTSFAYGWISDENWRCFILI